MIELYLTYEELKRITNALINTFNMVLPCCTLPMRNWNALLIPFHISLKNSFSCTLPMRNWNHYSSIKNLSIVSTVVPYLWGIETLTLNLHSDEFSYIVVPYLWGIETYYTSNFVIILSICAGCTLPMRNWNVSASVAAVSASLYLTYEELKHDNFFHHSMYLSTVVPYLQGFKL